MEKKYPIAETFTSPQGEGRWSGTLMTFIRFAGCTVGKFMPAVGAVQQGNDLLKIVNFGDKVHVPVPDWQEKCTAWDGREFLCDTDFQMKEKLTVADLLDRIPLGVQHVCLTGGEPLMHDLTPIVYACIERSIMVHIETSGTIQAPEDFLCHKEIWIAVSPKKGALPDMVTAADELKLLIDGGEDLNNLPEEIKRHKNVYLQPINSIMDPDKENLAYVMWLQKNKFPHWHLSLQMHKVLSGLLGELVR